MTLPNIPNTQYFEVVNLPYQIDLDEFANKLELDIDEFKHLNAGHLRSATSPDGPHRVLVPLDSISKLNDITENLSVLEIQSNQNNQLSHRVIAGETLWSIARLYSVKVAELLSWNNLSNHDILNLNQILKVFPN